MERVTKKPGDIMRVLIGCEFSGTVRSAFEKRGHYAVSCDILPTEIPGYHEQRDVREIMDWGWDLAIFHPPCTDICISGSRHFPEKIADGRQQLALDFVEMLMKAPIPKICIENPISVISSNIRKPDQIIQPWEFDHPEVKATCFWLKNLPKLIPTHKIGGDMFTPPAPEGREARIHRMQPGPNRWRERSRTFTNIANAMAEQWG
jgi:hypothetical protein